MMTIVYAVLALGIMGLVFGLVLAFASKIFAVEVDERIPAVQECLPGANCGACGFAGCDGYAKALAENEGIPQLLRARRRSTAVRSAALLQQKRSQRFSA